MKLSLQGTTILAASGDWGVAQLAGEPDVCIGKENKVFNPSILAG
jgi:subtilase family serine protease